MSLSISRCSNVHYDYAVLWYNTFLACVVVGYIMRRNNGIQIIPPANMLATQCKPLFVMRGKSQMVILLLDSKFA